MPVKAPLKTAGLGAARPLLERRVRRACLDGGGPSGAEPALLPCLEHQEVPHLVAPVARAGQMLLPLTADRPCVQKALVDQASLVEQGLGPVAQRTAQPVGERNGEALLRPLREFGRQVAREQL